jgi:RNA 2',3'-cyclic 3'-phosphodiesterase
MRLFVAVWPPLEVVAKVVELDRPAWQGVRWTTADQWHVTLRFFGSVPDGEVELLRESFIDPGPAAATATATWTTTATAMAVAAMAVAVTGPAVERLGRGVLCLPVAGLDDLAERVKAATAGVGVPEPDRPFKGHLTLARAKPGADLRPLAGARLSASWPVEEVTLVASQTRPDGATYHVLARAPAG